MSLGSNLQELRKARNWKQETLAEAAGVSLTQVSKIERDETDPRASTVVKLAQALDCSMDKLTLGMVPGGLDGKLKEAFERAQMLRPRDKGELISVIHKYCTASILMKEMAFDYEAEARRQGLEPGFLEYTDEQADERRNFEENMDDQERAELDELIKQEEQAQYVEQHLTK